MPYHHMGEVPCQTDTNTPHEIKAVENLALLMYHLGESDIEEDDFQSIMCMIQDLALEVEYIAISKLKEGTIEPTHYER
jgi:hypothetical protein